MELLDYLPPSQRRAVELSFGLVDGQERSLQELARELQVRGEVGLGCVYVGDGCLSFGLVDGYARAPSLKKQARELQVRGGWISRGCNRLRPGSVRALRLRDGWTPR